MINPRFLIFLMSSIFIISLAIDSDAKTIKIKKHVNIVGPKMPKGAWNGKYDQVPSTEKNDGFYKDMGQTEAEFFLNGRSDSDIVDEISKVQTAIQDLQENGRTDYNPNYLDRYTRPQQNSHKIAYLKGYLKILEEGVL